MQGKLDCNLSMGMEHVLVTYMQCLLERYRELLAAMRSAAGGRTADREAATVRVRRVPPFRLHVTLQCKLAAVAT